jgi:hypothetical protein
MSSSFGIFSPTDGESLNPILEAIEGLRAQAKALQDEVEALRAHFRCLIVLGFNMIADSDTLFSNKEAAIICDLKAVTLQRYEANQCVDFHWIEAKNEYRLTARTIRQLRDFGPGPAGEGKMTFVPSPKGPKRKGGGNGAP